MIDIGLVETGGEFEVESGLGILGMITSGLEGDLEVSVRKFTALLEVLSKKLGSKGSLGCGTLLRDRGGGDDNLWSKTA